MSSRLRLIILLILGLAVISLAVIVPVIFDSDYYEALGEQSEWTPAPTSESTLTPTLTSSPTQIIATATIEQSNSLGDKQNCTYTSLYWAYHPELWHAQVIIGDYNYTREDAVQVLSMNPQEVGVNLFIQLHAAFLNIVYGANPSEINQIMIDASNWLIANPLGSTPPQAEQLSGLELANLLEEFNTGVIGPGLCEDELLIELPTQTPNLTLTSVFETLMAASPTPTITLTSTSTPVPAVNFTSTPTRTKKTG